MKIQFKTCNVHTKMAAGAVTDFLTFYGKLWCYCNVPYKTFLNLVQKYFLFHNGGYRSAMFRKKVLMHVCTV